jgi:hypothetical protein
MTSDSRSRDPGTAKEERLYSCHRLETLSQTEELTWHIGTLLNVNLVVYTSSVIHCCWRNKSGISRTPNNSGAFSGIWPLPFVDGREIPRLGIPHAGVPRVGIPHPIISARPKTHVGPHTKCQLLLSDLNKNWSVLTNFIKTSQYQISWKSVQLFSNCYMRTNRRGEANGWILQL